MKKTVFILLTALLTARCADYLNIEHLLENTMDIETVFESRDYSDEWLAGVYNKLGGENMDVSSKRSSPFNMISDDIYFNDNRKSVDNGNTYEKYKNGNYGEGDQQGSWGQCYRGIRDASTYLLNIDKCTELTESEIKDRKGQARFLRAYFYWLLLRKYGPIPILPVEGLDFTAEYEDLAIPRSPYEECAEFIASEMALAAKDLQAVGRGRRDIARASRGAALAVRAKAYLYSASPLFNGNTDPWAAQLVDHEGKRLVSDVRSDLKWAKAAAAALDVMELNVYELNIVPDRPAPPGGSIGDLNLHPWLNYDYYSRPKTLPPPEHNEYSYTPFPGGWMSIDPFESYRQIFNGDKTMLDNNELIFTRGLNQGGESVAAMVKHQMPHSLGGWNAHGMTLKMYDAYYMDDGTEFKRDDPRVQGYTPDTYSNTETDDNYYGKFLPLPPGVSKQNFKREPRFYASVAYNGCIWDCALDPYLSEAGKQEFVYQRIFYYRGASDGKRSGNPEFYLPTGIGIKKYYHPDDYTRPGNDHVGISFKPEPAIRYADILLMYAEALNELEGGHTIPKWNGQGVHSVSRDVNEMRRAVKQVRMRAGLPDFADEIYADREEFRKKLKRERQIEFMGEGQRYFDLRRWKDAPKEENDLVQGFNVNMPVSQRDLFHTPVDVLILPSVFVDKMYLWPISHNELKKNRNLTQNPGWTYFIE